MFPLLAFNTLALKGNLLFGLPPNLSSEGVLKVNNTIVQPSVNLNWVLFDFGGNRANYDRAKSLALASKMALNATHEKVALQISRNYYQLLAAKEQLRAASVANDASASVEKSVQKRFENDLTTIVELDQARARRMSAYAQFVKTRGSVASERIALAASVGLRAGQAIDIAPLNSTPSAASIESSANDLLKRALANRPELLEAADQVRAAQYQAKRARSELLPKITIDAAEQYTSSTNSTNGVGTASAAAFAGVSNIQGNTYVIAGRLNWTLFDTGAHRARLRQAKSEIRQADDRLEDLRINVEQEVWNAYINVITALQEQGAAKASLDAAVEFFRASQEAYTSGTKDLLNLINSEAASAQAESAYAEARTHTLSAAAELAFSTGDLLSAGPRIPKTAAESR